LTRRSIASGLLSDFAALPSGVMKHPRFMQLHHALHSEQNVLEPTTSVEHRHEDGLPVNVGSVKSSARRS
jgi:hypothetical protein